MKTTVTPVALAEATRRRYLSYALSVIKARALPDVRDGLKPVQRRILYAMFHELHLVPEARYRKSAAVVGEVMAKYHPHGDSAIYDAMCRMAQDFALLHPLIDGQGNFGSIDGDNPAAMRYTEAKLRPIAVELLSELKQRTVDYRASYDGQRSEPIVLPAQFPALLVNGSEGIAVGMATSIPPHNLREVIDACLLMLEDPEASIAALCRKVKGPDFPTGGELVVDAGDLKQMYELGSGAVRVRGTWTTEQRGRKHYVVVDSIPYAVIKAKLVEEIGEHIRARKVPQIQDVRDESTDKVRVVLELRSPEDAEVAMAYLYKHTRLQAQFNVNLTALVPTDIVDGAQAERLDLRRILRHWLDFRFATVKRRLEFDLSELKARIHVLEGFAVIFDMLDEAIKIIRKSEGKRDAGEKLVARFGIDDLQADAILELKLYRLAKLEILVIREELAEKQAEADRIGKIIASRAKTWGVVKSELEEIRQQYGVSRKTRIAVGAPEIEYSADAYIVAEDAVVTLTRDGWLKRQGTVSTLDKVRVREGDTIGWAIRSTTTACFSAVSSAGTLYTIRVSDIPATTGYGEPIQKYFNFADGEKVVGAFGHDPRVQPAEALRTPVAEGDPPPPHVVAVSRDGKVVRLPAESFAEPSNRNGRIAMRLEENGDHVVAAYLAGGAEHCCIASKEGNVLTFPVREIPPLRGAGKGVLAMKLDDDASVFAFELSADEKSGPTVVTALGREEVVTPSRYAGTRAARGRSLFKRGYFASWKRPVEAVMGKAISPAEGPGSGTGGEA